MSSTPQVIDATRTIDQLCLSPHNVRTDDRDTSDTSELEASILKQGLLQAISVHPMRGSGSTKKWGAFAGGRRYRAIRRLIEREDLPSDWPVPVRDHVGYRDVELVELSITENLLRKDLRDYELFAAVRKANRLGDSVSRIADKIGRDEREVTRWLKMGELAEPVFAAFKAGELTLSQAQAYAATPDQALQAATFEQLRGQSRQLPQDIRAAMKVGDAEAQTLLIFVGADVYRAAGGRYDLDLFAEDEIERGRVVDEGLLRDLANTRLADEREKLRARAGRPDLRFIPLPPDTGYGSPDYTLQVQPRQIRTHEGEETVDRYELPEGDIVACQRILYGGRLDTSFWWTSRSAKFGAGAKPKPAGAAPPLDEPAAAPARFADGDALDDRAAPGMARDANDQIRDEHGVTGTVLQDLRHIRRALLRALLIEDAQRGGEVGQHYATWTALRGALLRVPSKRTGATLSPAGHDFVFDLPTDRTKALLGEMPAEDIWQGARDTLLKQNFLTEPDLAAAFLDYLNAPVGMRRLAGAVVAGLALERSVNAPGYRIAVHDAVAQVTRGTAATLRKLWRPTEAFLALFPSMQVLGFVEGLVDRDTTTRWSKLKAAEQRTAVARALGDATNGVRQGAKERARDWVHPLLAFRYLDSSKTAPSAELDQDKADELVREAAE